ncbi:MAG: hypothetical protein HQL65_07245 [Magnetococcales bacterium]|nr:hypothetical protein [Magnetococcales bacterium]
MTTLRLTTLRLTTLRLTTLRLTLYNLDLHLHEHPIFLDNPMHHTPHLSVHSRQRRSWSLFSSVALMLVGLGIAMSVHASGVGVPEVVMVGREGLDPGWPTRLTATRPGILRSDWSLSQRFVFYRQLLGLSVSRSDHELFLLGPATTWIAPEAPQQSRAPETDGNKLWNTVRALVNEPVKDFSQASRSRKPFKYYRSDENYYVDDDDTVMRICHPDAFKVAAETLQERIRSHGADHPEVREWVRGQEMVFANCNNANQTPDLLPGTVSPWLQADRAYQRAAALFYQNRLPQALAAFQEIAADTTSPWQALAIYLQARTLIHMAKLCQREAETSWRREREFDPPGDFSPPPLSGPAREKLAQARLILESMLKDSRQTAYQRTASLTLNRIDYLLQPETLATTLEHRLLAPQLSPDAAIEFHDFILLLTRKKQKTDLGTWLQLYDQTCQSRIRRSQTNYLHRQITNPRKYGTCQTGPTSNKMQQPVTTEKPPLDPQAMFHLWQKKGTLPWLVVALAMTRVDDPWRSEVEQAGQYLPPESPAYLTVRWHLARLLIQDNRLVEARSMLDDVLALPDLDTISRNLFLVERLATAPTQHLWLLDATRRAAYVANFNEISDPESRIAVPLLPEDYNKYFTQRLLNIRKELQQDPRYFDSDVVSIFNTSIPIKRLHDIALKNPFPRHLHRDTILLAWVRAIVLNRLDLATDLAPELAHHFPETNPIFTRFTASQEENERAFLAALAILRLPGANLDFRPGFGYFHPRNEIGHHHGRWWADPVTPAQDEFPAQQDDPDMARDHTRLHHILCPTCVFHEFSVQPPIFIQKKEMQQAIREQDRLSRLPGVLAWTAARILPWVRSHPEEPLAPEALHLLVRCGRFSHQKGDQPRQAWNLLHKHYPNSPWTQKTPYWYQ